MSSIEGKIKSIDELSKILETLRRDGKRIVQCHGVFDLIHPGHIKHLESAKKQGDVLVVTITRDRYVRKGPGRPIFNEVLRAETLASLEIVDYVSLVDDYTASECIKALKPDVYAKGQDYQDKDNDLTGKIYEEEEALRSINGKLYFSNEISFSSSNLINQFLDVYPPEIKAYLKSISSKYSASHIIKQIKFFHELKILVIGDAIIDEYHYCENMGMSRKDHLVVSKYLSEESFAGGSFAIANHIAGLSKEVHLLTVLGKTNSCEDFILKHLRPNIKTHFYYREDAPTTVKRRFINQYLNQKVFEICYMNDQYLPEKCEVEIIDLLSDILPGFDAVVVADFGHGLLTKRIIGMISDKARAFAVNAQTNSANVGFNAVTKYHKPDYICFNEFELRLAAQEKYGPIEDVVENIANIMDCNYIIITRGSKGSLGFGKKEGFYKTPAFSTKVIDRVGSGDAFFAFSAPCCLAGMPLDMVSFIGNAAGALACQIVCNKEPVDTINLFKFIETLLK